MTHIELLDCCQATYAGAQIVAGPEGRDGASVLLQPDGSAVLVFRGTTESILDWLNDGHVEHVAGDGLPGLVHGGFLASLDALWPAVQASLAGVRSLTITGHSKGGSLAILAGARLPQAQVVTFAAALAGDHTFQRLYPAPERVIRYEGSGDAVPMLPPWYETVGSLRTDDPLGYGLRGILVGQMIARRQWERLAGNHHLNSYRPWVASWPATRGSAA